MTATFARICADPRHHSIRVLQDRRITAREFGTWSMMHRRAEEPADAYDAAVRRLLRNASETIRTQITGLIATGAGPSPRTPIISQ
ncbi:hypothetical protein BH10PSE15_BH10PSE15_10440 [soil metagenome]